MYCKNCGSELSADSKFCSKCGAEVTVKVRQQRHSPSMPISSIPEKPKGQINSCTGCLAIIVAIVIIGIVVAAFSSNDSSTTTSQNANTQSTSQTESTAEPTDAPTESPQQRKKEFLQNVDESISSDRIAGNPYKFVGDDVDLHGTVVKVLDDSHFNMSTGDVESGNYAVILVETDLGDASDLEADQAIRVMGSVAEPTEGTNAMGGAGEFPTVKAEFME